MKFLISCIFLLWSVVSTFAQDVDYDKPKEEWPFAKEIEKYGRSNQSVRIEMANRLMSGDLQDYCGMNCTFDRKTDAFYRDACIFYWSAFYAYETEHFGEAVGWVKRAEDLLVETDSVFFLSDCYALTSCIYMQLSDFTEAMLYSERSLALNRTTGDSLRLSSSLNNIAAICVFAKNIDLAEQYAREALQIEQKMAHPRSLSGRLGVLSDILVKANKPEEALVYATEAVRIEEGRGDHRKLAIRQSQLATALFAANHIEEARDIALEAADSLKVFGNLTSLIITYRLLANAETQLGNKNYAVDYLKRGLELCQKNNNMYQEAQVCLQMARLLTGMDCRKANFYWEEYARLTDSIYNDKMTKQMLAFNVRYQTASQQTKLVEQQDMILHHRTLLVACIVLLVGLALVASLLARLVKVRGANIKMLKENDEMKSELLALANQRTLQAETARQQILDVASRMAKLGETDSAELTAREIQIIQLLSKGLLSKEVAEQLNISVRTVDTHKNHIYRKLGISTTVELLRYAEQKGLVSKE